MIYVLIALRYIAYLIVTSALIYGFWHEKKVVAWEEKIRRKLDKHLSELPPDLPDKET